MINEKKSNEKKAGAKGKKIKTNVYSFATEKQENKYRRRYLLCSLPNGPSSIFSLITPTELQQVEKEKKKDKGGLHEKTALNFYLGIKTPSKIITSVFNPSNNKLSIRLTFTCFPSYSMS